MLFLDVFAKILFPKHLNAAGERTHHWNIGTWFRYFVVQSFVHDPDFHLLLPATPEDPHGFVTSLLD